jgi:hypothetical protein
MKNGHLVQLVSKTGKEFFIASHQFSRKHFFRQMFLQDRNQVIDWEWRTGADAYTLTSYVF